MAHPLVVHKNRAPYDVYVGRPTEWGNLWSHREGTRAYYKTDTVEEAIEQYRQYLWRAIQREGRPMLVKLSLLHGKTLACWCAPGPCHAEVLVAASEYAVRELAKS